MPSKVGDQRYSPGGWVFGNSTREIISKAKEKYLTRSWINKYDVAVIKGRPVGGQGGPKLLWTIGDGHRSFKSAMACVIVFTLKDVTDRKEATDGTDTDLTLF
jgi:hypothetical protein